MAEGRSTARREPKAGPARAHAAEARDRAGRVAPGGKVQPITASPRDGRREPTGRIAPERGASRPAARGKGAPGRIGTWVSVLFFVALTAGAVAGRVAIWLVLFYALMSVVTLICYAVDKRAAVLNRQRTPERSLHLLALCSGWPGALLGQSVLRHKSSKASFQWAFRATVLVNLAVLAWLIWSRIGVGWDHILIDAGRAAGAFIVHAIAASRH